MIHKQLLSPKPKKPLLHPITLTSFIRYATYYDITNNSVSCPIYFFFLKIAKKSESALLPVKSFKSSNAKTAPTNP